MTDTAGNPIDPAVFVLGANPSPNPITKFIDTYTVDVAKAATFDLRLEVSYVIYPTVLVTQDF